MAGLLRSSQLIQNKMHLRGTESTLGGGEVSIRSPKYKVKSNLALATSLILMMFVNKVSKLQGSLNTTLQVNLLQKYKIKPREESFVLASG